MREIKFRVWDKKKKRILYPRMKDVDNNGELVISFSGIVHEHYFIKMGYGDGAGGDCFNVDDDYELMQYTGLKDKNGKEIYEGDIVKQFDENDNLTKGDVSFHPPSFVIIWHPSVLGISFTKLDYRSVVFCEVIGNIYQDTELLKN